MADNELSLRVKRPPARDTTPVVSSEPVQVRQTGAEFTGMSSDQIDRLIQVRMLDALGVKTPTTRTTAPRQPLAFEGIGNLKENITAFKNAEKAIQELNSLVSPPPPSFMDGRGGEVVATAAKEIISGVKTIATEMVSTKQKLAVARQARREEQADMLAYLEKLEAKEYTINEKGQVVHRQALGLPSKAVAPAAPAPDPTETVAGPITRDDFLRSPVGQDFMGELLLEMKQAADKAREEEHHAAKIQMEAALARQQEEFQQAIDRVQAEATQVADHKTKSERFWDEVPDDTGDDDDGDKKDTDEDNPDGNGEE